MRRTGLALLAAASMLLQTACPGDTGPAEQRRDYLTFGTIISVEIYGADATHATRAFDALGRYFDSVNRDWYAYGDGELARVNQALSQGETVTLSEPLARLTHRALELYRRSDGLFDPGVGALVKIWGFHDSRMIRDTPPDAGVIEDWLHRQTRTDQLELDGRRLRSSGPIILDFGGIAKGTALASAAALLHDHGIENAIVNAGGDLVVLGSHGDRPWRVGIRDPRSVEVLRSMDLRPGEAIVTSGDYERFFKHAGKRYHHLLDPRSGYPVTSTASVTVIDDDPELADAAATALMVGGPTLFPTLPQQLGIRYALLIDADGRVLVTPAMQQRLAGP